MDRRFDRPAATSRTVRYGDRLFARIVLHGKTVAEFVNSQVNDLTELLSELRRLTRGLRGLAQLYIRNFSRGWSFERPMMLYAAGGAGPERRPVATERYGGASYYREPRREERMPFPWETH